MEAGAAELEGAGLRGGAAEAYVSPACWSRGGTLGPRLALRAGLHGLLPPLAALLGVRGEALLVCGGLATLAALLEAAPAYSPALAVRCRSASFAWRVSAALLLDALVCWALHRPAGQELEEPQPLFEALATLSVVLPCANEGDFVWRTVKAVFDATPAEELAEILIIDDGSDPPVSGEIPADFLEAHKARIIRHGRPQGLIRSKKDGGDAARGDSIVFLDCHVRPMEDWTGPILAHLRENPRRIVVPLITALDPDTWEEVSREGGSKMCLTWNADFIWCNEYPGPFVPIMSGGLLAISRYWWRTTGGYDEHMLSWGGENLDQSLRTWLCGGEIRVATGSRVAHMWRDPSKPKTQLRYSIPTDDVRRNRMRAVAAWLGPWAEKVRSFPEFEDFRAGGRLEIGSLENIRRYQEKLRCDGFASYLERFRDLYLGTGRLPVETFHLRDRRSGLCLEHVVAGARPPRPPLHARGMRTPRYHYNGISSVRML